jgi:hypothetical protein
MGKQIALVAGGNKGPGKKLATLPQDGPSGGFFNDAGTVAW